MMTPTERTMQVRKLEAENARLRMALGATFRVLHSIAHRVLGQLSRTALC
jgi:hypothetical protein